MLLFNLTLKDFVFLKCFNFEDGIRVRKTILKVWSSLMCDQEGQNETVRMSRRNRRRDSTMDSNSHVAVQILDVIYLFSEIIFGNLY